jgi:hypothetical protein
LVAFETLMKLSLTTISLGIRKFEILAELYIELEDWDKVKDEVLRNNLFNLTSKSSTVRQCREIRQRIQALHSETLEDFMVLGTDERKFIAFIAICKTYPFVFEFTVQVLAEKLVIYDYQVKEVDFTSFWNEKTMDHPELDKITESTQKKIKQVLIRTLAEVGLLDSTSSQRITPFFPMTGLDDVFNREGKKYRKILLTA